MKKIFIMRHGEAQPLFIDDQQRMLSDLGKLEVQTMAKRLQQDCVLDAILSSSYVRTKQSANIMASEQHSIRFTDSFEDFVPTADAQNATELIKALISLKPQLNNWLLVAHMPIVSFIVERFCPDNIPSFGTAAVAEIHYDEETDFAELIAMHLP
jgi:phosphohistidine phosphatase